MARIDNDPTSASHRDTRRRLVVGAAAALSVMSGIGLTAPGHAATRCSKAEPSVLAQSVGSRIAFGANARRLTLAPTCGPLKSLIRRAPTTARFFLVVEDLRTTRQPGAIFDISLAHGAGEAGKRSRMLGTLNFFNAHAPAAGEGRRVSYDVTAQLKALARQASLSRGVTLAIAPMSAPERTSDASAGAIKLIMQTR